MKILRIVYDWPDKNTIQEGLAPAPYELSLAQIRLGHKIVVLCGNLNGKNFKRSRFKTELANGLITVYNMPRALAGFGPFLTTSLVLVPSYIYLKFTFKPDIIHNHGHLGVWFLLYKFLFGWLDKTPVVGHFHILAKSREVALKKQSDKLSFLTKYWEYPIHKFSDLLMSEVSAHIIAVGNDLANDIKLFYKVRDRKITVVESGVDTIRFNNHEEKYDYGFSEDSVVIGNIGRLSKRKNIDKLVSALSKLDEKYKLVLCGTWDRHYKDSVQKLAENLKVSNRIKYFNSISYFEIDPYFRAIDIFVLPSSYEGLPKVILEALSSGSKVIASGFTISHEISDLHFLNEITVDEIANKINEVDSTPSNYPASRKIIENFYGWDIKAAQIDDIYNSLKS
ncbi:MAG: hypothetical protein QG570_358 [Patescibacteria group bacterium]|nr:hypothetical protein [Patescibacteria group bacterium]